MKKIFRPISLYLLIISMFSPSCRKNWLDAKSNQSLAIPSSLQDFQALLDNDGIMNANGPALGEVGSDGHYILSSRQSYLTSFPGERNAYTWTDSLPNLKVLDWNDAYFRIFTCNTVLDGLGSVNISSSADQQTWNNVQGQALFQRAFNFWELAQEYAPPYDSSTASQDLSIPLRLSSDITKPSARSTVQQTYSQIISDLIKAKNELPVTPLVRTRASKAAVFGLLARVFLSIGDYSDAGNYADSCLGLYNMLIDYNSLSTTPLYVGLLNSEVIFHNEMTVYFSIYGSFLRIDSSLYASYESNDLRSVVFFKPQTDGTIGWSGNYSDERSYMFNGLAVDEMYLIRAESSVRMGNVASGVADLNTLLTSRWATGTYPPYATNNADSALTEILTERNKELLMRGLRWSDLRRLNKDSRFQVTISRVVNGNTYSIAPNSYEYTLPFPDDIIQETSMKQNPGWPR